MIFTPAISGWLCIHSVSRTRRESTRLWENETFLQLLCSPAALQHMIVSGVNNIPCIRYRKSLDPERNLASVSSL